ncbi:MAG: hypothetical protein ACXVAN_14280, partial [Polyangia bacterium]
VTGTNPRLVTPSLPDALADSIARCLAKSPKERPSAAALARELGAFADEAGARALEKLAPPSLIADITKASPKRRATPEPSPS